MSLHNVSNEPFFHSQVGDRESTPATTTNPHIWPCQWYHSRGFFSLSLENPRFCVVWWTKMRIKTKTEKWSSLKRKQLTWQQQRVLRDVKKFYHHKASFSPLSLSLYALSLLSENYCTWIYAAADSDFLTCIRISVTIFIVN